MTIIQKTVLGLGFVLVLAAIGIWIFASHNGSNPKTVNATSTGRTSVDETVVRGEGDVIDAVVTYSDGKFDPATLGPIAPGSTVQFVNEGDTNMWVASNVHPEHTELLGFDALTSIEPGDSYEYTFEKVGTWHYHNHLNPSQTGTIEVTQL